jgi:hypothetical protein
MSLGVINLHTNGAKVFMKSFKIFKTQEFHDLFKKSQSSIKLVLGCPACRTVPSREVPGRSRDGTGQGRT